jgi:hypothetical protein
MREAIGGMRTDKQSGNCEFWSRKDFPLDLWAFVGDRFAQIILGLTTDQNTGGDAKIALETLGGVG